MRVTAPFSLWRLALPFRRSLRLLSYARTKSTPSARGWEGPGGSSDAARTGRSFQEPAIALVCLQRGVVSARGRVHAHTGRRGNRQERFNPKLADDVGISWRRNWWSRSWLLGSPYLSELWRRKT